MTADGTPPAPPDEGRADDGEPAGLPQAQPPADGSGGLSVARNSAVLVFGTIASRLAAFASAVILARRFDPADFAVIVLAQAAAQYLVMVVDFGFTLTGIRLVAERPARLRPVMGAILGLRAAVGLAGVAFMWLLTTALGFSELSTAVFVLFAVATALGALDVSWVGQARESTEIRALVLGGTSLLGLAVLVVALAIWSAPIVAPIAQLIGTAVFAIVSLVSVGRRYGVPSLPDWAVVRAIAVHALPIGLATLLAQVYYNLDLLLLGAMRSSHEVGTYGAIYKLILGLLAVGWTYAVVVLPRLARAGADGPAAQRLELGGRLRQLVVVMVPASLLAAILARPIIELVFGARYVDGALPFTLLLLSVPVSSVGSLILYSLVAAGRTWALPISSGCGALVNVAFNLFLIPRFGMIGAAWATIIAVLVVLVLALAQARDHLPRWDVRATLRLLVALAALSAVAIAMRDLPLPLSSLAAAAAFLGLVEALRIMPAESARARQLLHAGFDRVRGRASGG